MYNNFALHFDLNGVQKITYSFYVFSQTGDKKYFLLQLYSMLKNSSI
jgi:hypothetical protein